jgi:glycosyltransferase involved in cell wall biosynthesis
MNRSTYSVLIRTFNSENTLPATLRSLDVQTQRPSEYVIVDSGSTDNTLKLLPRRSVVHRFVGARFNYSEALNQGVEHISTDYVLIISSHTALENRSSIECALNALNSDERIGAAYFCSNNAGPLKHDVIDEGNFNGFNGLWNTCSIIRVPLLRKRAFRPDVFAAEDQEWARWLFTEEHMVVARFSGAGMANNNPKAASLRKCVNEYVAVAYFVNRQLLGWRNLARVGFTVITPRVLVSPRQRFLYLWMLGRLAACHIAKPEVLSRHF